MNNTCRVPWRSAENRQGNIRELSGNFTLSGEWLPFNELVSGRWTTLGRIRLLFYCVKYDRTAVLEFRHHLYRLTSLQLDAISLEYEVTNSINFFMYSQRHSTLAV